MRKERTFFGIEKILPFLKPYRKTLITMIVLGILSSLIDSIYPLFNRFALNSFIYAQSLDQLPLFLVVYILTAVVQEFDNFYCLYQCGKVEMSMDRDLREASFTHLQTLSFSYFNQNSVGYIHSRVMSDTSKIGDLVSWKLMDLVWNISYILSMFVLMFSMNVQLTLFVIALIPIAIVLILFFQRKLVVLNRKIRDVNAKITGGFNESITGISSIKTLHVEDKMIADFDTDTQDMYRQPFVAHTIRLYKRVWLRCYRVLLSFV